MYINFVNTDGMMKKLEESVTETDFKLLIDNKYEFLRFNNVYN